MQEITVIGNKEVFYICITENLLTVYIYPPMSEAHAQRALHPFSQVKE